VIGAQVGVNLLIGVGLQIDVGGLPVSICGTCCVVDDQYHTVEVSYWRVLGGVIGAHVGAGTTLAGVGLKMVFSTGVIGSGIGVHLLLPVSGRGTDQVIGSTIGVYG